VSDILARLQSALSDRYSIQRELGRGGMATVYLATDLKHDREVAIKVLHPELASVLGPERFDREIRFAAKLQHPNILGLYDSGEADHLLYYVMPFVQGESLRERLNRDHLLPVDFAIHVALEVADALGYAHSLGIIHRDIKPENIMLAGGHALVADFGIARAVTAAGSSQKLTQTGMAVGTPLYMSPEQSVGEQVGPTGDLYSLACVLYEMLAGHPPFSGSNARQIIARHAMEQVPSLQVVRDTVPDQVEDAIMATLNKVPADRPQTAAQFVELLGAPPGATASRYAAARITATRRSAAQISPPGAVTLTLKRRSILAGGIAAAVVLVLVSLSAFYLISRLAKPSRSGDPERLRRVAVLYFDDQSGAPQLSYLAEGLTDALISALSTVQGLTVVSRGGVEQFRDDTIPLDSIGRALQVGTLVTGTIQQQRGKDVMVALRLVDAASGTQYKAVAVRGAADDPFKLRDSLAAEAAQLVREWLGQEIKLRNQREGTRNVEAWSLLQRAEQARKRGDALASAGDTAGMTREYLGADSLAAAAEAGDRTWPDPTVLRGQLDYRRSLRMSEDALRAGPLIDKGIGHAQQALKIDPNNPDALELLGNLRYWRLLLGLETEASRSQALLDSAQADLERATTINPTQAGAWATLSHLYYRTKSNIDVNLAARRAYEADAFLSNADKVLQRLFYSSYDLGQFTESAQWCAEGARRFSGNPKFVECQLLLLATKAKDPDLPLAWRLADSLVKLAPVQEQNYQRLNGQMIVAAVLARANQTDSAKHLAGRSMGDAEVDASRDLTLLGAYVYELAGDRDAAINALKIYFAANPGQRAGFAEDAGWMFRDLSGDPRFKQLVGATK